MVYCIYNCFNDKYRFDPNWKSFSEAKKIIQRIRNSYSMTFYNTLHEMNKEMDDLNQMEA